MRKLVVFLALAFASPTQAQVSTPEDLTRAERTLALTLARVAYNEAGDHEPDLELIWQVVSHAETSPEERLRWLRNHSPCVTGRLTQDQAYRRPGNCRWTRNLQPDGRRPRGWDRALHGRWSWIRDRWTAHLERAVEYVRGNLVADICPETPTSWDGARWREQIVERGWRILECDGTTQNLGVVRASPHS